ncbi:similar to transmembrane emp24 domain-containing protein 2 precursor [Plenodomus lingam JN3]|uniref:Similar to transmembrane emp24 domain-containing protein 2 n=2 Tax=Leptosphaeria maculans TaxID=5022 RepID=E5AEH2_LEPMJ|nr:similar to transmembrane emp24 domain-containing protein 2 precursor [Plenodomus lingam JN3]CBY01611.1 similar to transmembrane emp24 domain-containing protein 2 precursor [Plenodomus lingam JN3]
MRLLLTITGLIATFLTTVSATALTYLLGSHERACFFAHVENKGSKVAFYFAVQSGGSFDIDYVVSGPVTGDGTNDRVILDGFKERQGDFVFTANEVGEYKFCFNNEMSTWTEKMVDFEIAVENETERAKIPSKQGSSPEQTSVLEESILKVSAQLSTISRNQKYFRTRENRNFSTVKSTEKRIFNFSLMESGLIVTMAGLQVFIVRFFFQGARKGIL